MSLELFFSLSTRYLCLALRKNNQLVKKLQLDNFKQHSENFLSHLSEFLSSENLTLADLSSFFFTLAPGGQTGIRVSLSFLSAIKVLNPKVQMFFLDTLLLQAGNSRCLSLLSADNKGRRYYFALCDQGEIIEKGVVDQEKIDKDNNQTLIKDDLSQSDWWENFLQLEKKFQPLEDFMIDWENY